MQTTRARPGSPAAAPLVAASLVTVLLATPTLLRGVARAADTTGADVSSGALEEIVVTATRRAENLRDVPFSTSVLRGDELEALGDAGQDIKQLAFQVPSLNIESSNGRAFPRLYIRGYGNTDYHDFASQPVGLVYDDIVQENAALKGFPIFDQQDVEVLRGPQGTLFGRNSPAGVLKLESAKPQLGATSGFFALSDGSYDSAVFQGVVNLPVNDVTAFRASVQGQYRENWVTDSINDTKLGGYDDWAARLQLLFQPSDSFSALFNIHDRNLGGSSTLFRANIIQPGNNQLIPGFDPARIFTDGPNEQGLNTVGANVHLTWTLPNLTLQSITGYESVTHYFSLGDIDGGYGPGFFCGPPVPNDVCAQPSGPGPIPFAVETSAGLASHYQLTQEFRVVSRSDGPLQGQAGVFFFYENVTAADDDYCAPGSTAPTCGSVFFTLQDTTISQQKNDAEAIFGSLEYAVSGALKARAGIRLTQDHKSFATLYSDTDPLPTPPLAASARASNVSWDVSTTYELAPEANLYARIATGFRAPSFGEPAAGIPIQVARSETNISYETGVKADLFERRARLSFDVYYFDVSHQQLSAVGGASDVTTLLNAAKTIGYGSEFELDVHPVPNLTLNLSGSLNDTRIEDRSLSVAVCFSCTVINPTFSNASGTFAYINGNPLPEAAKWVGDVSLRYDVPVGPAAKVYAYTDLSYRSGINFVLYESAEFDSQPLTQWGLRLGYEWSGGRYDVAAFCRNCMNQIRTVGAIDFDNLTGYINDPRVIGGQFRMKF